MKFSYCNTTKLFFASEIEELAKYLIDLEYRRILVITGGNNTAKRANTVVEVLRDAGLEILFEAGVKSNPLSEKVCEIVYDAKAFMPDVILTIGGGSVHDTGKAVSVMFMQEGDVEDYTVNGKYSVPGIKKALPVVTVPTLCGSGAEVSPAALVRIGNEKRVIFSPILHPLASFYIIQFLGDVPATIMARSAFDSFVQALEGYVSTCANSISDSFAEITLRYFNETFSNIMELKLSEKDIEKLCIASSFSSYVCSTASVGAIHAISNPISGHFDVHHGTALSMIARSVVTKNFDSVPKKRINSLCKILGIDRGKEAVTAYLDSVISRLKLLDGVKKTKVSKKLFSEMVAESNNGDMNGNPRAFTEEDIAEVLGEWYDIQ